MSKYTIGNGMTLEGVKDHIFMVNHLQFDWNSFQLSRFKLTFSERALLYLIEKQNIETFFFCDDSALLDVDHFWWEAITNGIPNMIRWLFVNSTKIGFSVSCYVNTGDRVLVFTSGSLIVEHFYDVDKSVIVLCKMLQSYIESYLFLNFGVRLATCTINRLRLNVNRLHNTEDTEEKLTLPIQYRSLLVQQSHNYKLNELNVAMANHFMDVRFPMPIKDKLYLVEQSLETKKLSMVLHHTEERQQHSESDRTYVIMTDILGNFKNVLEITDPLTCRQEVATFLICDRCDAKFILRTSFEIHQQLKCCEEVNVDFLDSAFEPFFSNYLPITRNEHNYSWYGVICNSEMP